MFVSQRSDIGDYKALLLEDICKNLNRDSKCVDIISSGEDYTIVNEERIGKKYKVIKDYTDTAALEEANQKLKIFEDRGFKFGDYVELLFAYDSMLYYSSKEFVFYKFTIDNVIVEIDTPSLLFDISMNGFYHDKYYDSDNYHTISLKGITENNYEEYLTKALFLIGYYNPSINDETYPECFEFLGEYSFKYAADELEIEKRRKNYANFENKKFDNIQYHEALAFYNEGKRLIGHEISFQYFYKVLEHFFLICRQDEFKTIISEYNSKKDINDFIALVTDIYRQNEDSQLYVLLKTLEVEISKLINEGYTKGYIKENNVESFSKELYLYRNTIVHGKSDDKFSIKIPSCTGSAKESFWNMAAEKIAELLIVKYCL